MKEGIHPNYGQTAEADKKRNAFDPVRLVNRRMERLNPSEQYTVYEVEVAEDDSDTDEDILNYDDIDNPELLM